MFGRLVKAQFIDPAKQHGGYFKGNNWTKQNYPRLQNRKKAIKRINNPVKTVDHQKFIKKTVEHFTGLSKKLKAAGIDLDFKLGDAVF